MKTKKLWLIAGVFATAGFPLTAGAAGSCLAGISGGMGCTIVDAASLSPTTQESGGAMKIIASANASSSNEPGIVAITESPKGQTYGRWAVEWWEWAIGIPLALNPVADTKGSYCAQRQVDEVWFLAGSFSSDPVVRACKIPAGKSLFFPLINNVYFAFLNDPPNTRTEQFVRAQSSCSESAQISVKIDGFDVSNPTQYFTGEPGSQSPIFNVQLPPATYSEPTKPQSPNYC